MKSEKAKQYIIEHAEKDGDTCHYYVHDSEAFEAVSIAEEEIKQRAVEAFRHFVEDYCNESGKKDIAKDSEHYIKVFEELINR
ncbi:hypothetical protein LI160_01720 [Bacteroides xylanisolvens]|uniref:hypothetical protein n=1 Tax=Bacteroides xylanisolvens TaxID=371601 RepID=UPI001D085498|nr:hypothetical protein [Bacteroides xylanisolvens]MCB6712306.1 hypothetical protein [Bacteroides xylanisolvens]MCB6732362.1 hypothetical protein [Bacteroides xylanisolvens]MCB7119677.1 hypothetical protein [Bacteroides xylanisolvens]